MFAPDKSRQNRKRLMEFHGSRVLFLEGCDVQKVDSGKVCGAWFTEVIDDVQTRLDVIVRGVSQPDFSVCSFQKLLSTLFPHRPSFNAPQTYQRDKLSAGTSPMLHQ